ncbi:putative MFS family arabinose efflux permease [Nocardiopsis sp. Huas11]|uniref:MFS transporter n=1 Tax=Nocardiopsis sp. Huas11 TaxID=2183912 RepID=UPI000EAE4150|nr:MFS transporter [Nocardiopsis sp. Huas11]RKS04678.1 putative MFS family arabinose efflux permease [Nocardiopsis sp. Huas11]
MRRSPTIYFTSYALSLLGSGIASVVIPLLVLDRTGDILAAGIMATVGMAVSAMTGLFSGLLVDRVDRRAVSVVANVLTALSMAALLFIDLTWGLNLAWFLAMAVIGALIRVPGMTAQETLLPALARLGDTEPGRNGRPVRLDQLVAVRETVGNVLLLAGPGLGGLLVALFGLSPAILLAAAATSLLAALSTLVLDPRAGRVPPREPVPADAAEGALRRAAADLADGWRFLFRNRLVLGSTLVTGVFIAVLSVLQTTLMPAYFTEQNLPELTGLTLSAIAAGSIGGSMLYAAFALRVRRRVWFVIGMVGALVGFAAVGSMASPWLVLGGAALAGFLFAPAGGVLGVLTIEATPDAMRGRVLGAQNTVMLSAPALTSAPLAAVASVAGLPVAGAVIAVLVGATALGALVAPAFRGIDDPGSEQEEDPDPCAVEA